MNCKFVGESTNMESFLKTILLANALYAFIISICLFNIDSILFALFRNQIGE